VTLLSDGTVPRLDPGASNESLAAVWHSYGVSSMDIDRPALQSQSRSQIGSGNGQ